MSEETMGPADRLRARADASDRAVAKARELLARVPTPADKEALFAAVENACHGYVNRVIDGRRPFYNPPNFAWVILASFYGMTLEDLHDLLNRIGVD